MTKLEFMLIKTVQFASLAFFTFVVMVYLGIAILLPLAVLLGLINLLDHGIGFNGIFATIVAIPTVIWLLRKIHSIEGVTPLLVDTGWSLIKMGAENFRKFDAIARPDQNDSVKGHPASGS